MASLRPIWSRERLELAGDGCLVTAAIFGLLVALLLATVAMIGGQGDAPVAVQIASALIIPAGGIGGPVLVWLLHGRRISLLAVAGGAVGAFAAGLLSASAALLSWPLAWLLSPVSRSQFAGPIALLVIIATAFVALAAWLVIDAVRDHFAERRHTRVDLVRFASVLSLAALGAVTAFAAARPGGAEVVEAPIFALVAGIAGALMLLGADIVTTLSERTADAQAETDDHSGD